MARGVGLRVGPRAGAALAMGVAGGVAASLPLFWERLRLRRHHLSLSAELPRLRVLQLSDFHLGEPGLVGWLRRQRVARAIRDLRPDLIALTGDFLQTNAGLRRLPAWLALLPPAPLGCWAVLGNHDYLSIPLARAIWLTLSRRRRRFAANDTAALCALLRAHGVTPLVNEAAPLANGWWVAGVDDWRRGRPDLRAALAALPDGAPLLLLSHNPNIVLDPTARRAVLTLAGHTHGGQVMLCGRTRHTQGTWLPVTRPAGHFPLPWGHLFVSSGLGEGIPLRWRVPPEIGWIEIGPEGSP